MTMPSASGGQDRSFPDGHIGHREEGEVVPSLRTVTARIVVATDIGAISSIVH